MSETLQKLLRQESLTRAEARVALGELVSGTLSVEQIAACLQALGDKGETADEIAGFVDEMLARAQKVALPGERFLDVCGTGGDASQTFNLSTAAAILLAALGVGVVKHGNRSISSRCGSIDVLEALGVAYATSPREAQSQFAEHSITFLFAPHFHPALKSVGPARKAIGKRTTFNLLGPLANPAGATHQVIGVYDPALTRAVAEAFGRRGGRRALVVHSADGLDELSVSAPTRGHFWDGAAVTEFAFEPESVGIRGRSLSDLRGGDATENARLIAAALSSADDLAGAAAREAVALNAAAGLWVYGSASTIGEGYALARGAIADGRAERKLRALRASGGRA